jgi:hypothetical protein
MAAANDGRVDCSSELAQPPDGITVRRFYFSLVTVSMQD